MCLGKTSKGPRRLMRACSICPIYLGDEKAQVDLIHFWFGRGIKKREPDSPQWFPVKGQETIDTNLNTGNFTDS